MAGKRRPKIARDKAPALVTVRHYCQGIGDCHLLTFKDGDGKPFRMLIDCGVHSSVKGGKEKINEIIDDIAAVTGGWIDVLIVTHEHWDHISGFMTATDRFVQKKPRKGEARVEKPKPGKEQIEVGAVWMGWTENPADGQARDLDKFKGAALAALDQSHAALAADGYQTVADPAFGFHLGTVHGGLTGVLEFFGLKGQRVRTAREIVESLVDKDPEYLEPSDQPVRLRELPNLRIYVLGPPRSAKMLGIRERASEMYGLGGLGGWPMATALANAFGAASDSEISGGDVAAPFEAHVGANLTLHLESKPGTKFSKDEEIVAELVRQHYIAPRPLQPDEEEKIKKKNLSAKEARQIVDQRWRRIDHDWLGASADLAIQLDDRTNNSSLVLAFEFVDSGHVLLFTGDAQAGSWLSWQDLKWKIGDDTVTGPDLLGRTVYYKVGHHGSHNATLRQKGLELMNHPDFAAFIPTNEADAKNVKWGAMPLKAIVDELGRRAAQRVIRADDPWLKTKARDPRFNRPSGCIKRVNHQPNLWVELDIA